MAGPDMLIDRRKLFEQVASHLERQILDGTLKPGERLPPERDLQERFGVGRPAIREALVALQRAGLVEVANGMRARVAVPSASSVLAGMAPAVRQLIAAPEGQRHLHGVRAFFEIGLARYAAQTATAEDVARLAAALADNEAALGQPGRFIDTDVAFHYVLAEIPRNPAFTALHEAMSAWLVSQRALTLAAPGQEARAYASHRAIHAAIAAGDPDAAETAMRGHMEQLGFVLAEMGQSAVSDTRRDDSG